MTPAVFILAFPWWLYRRKVSGWMSGMESMGVHLSLSNFYRSIKFSLKLQNHEQLLPKKGPHHRIPEKYSNFSVKFPSLSSPFDDVLWTCKLLTELPKKKIYCENFLIKPHLFTFIVNKILIQTLLSVSV